MKRLFVIIVALFVGFAYAANENVPTSKKFVDDALAQKQPKFDGLGNDKLMLYSKTADGVVASRDIVTTLGNSTSADSVPTVGAINAGLDTKQDILNGDAGWVVTNTDTSGIVTQKPIYSATNNYSNALVEVETLNNAVINAVNSELTVVPGVGWTINTASNLNLLPTPQTYGVLPVGYTQLEYLESDGTQYINLGQPVGSGENITTQFAYMDDTQGVWFGARDGNSYSAGFTFDFATYADSLYIISHNVALSKYRAYLVLNLALMTPYTLHWYGHPFRAPTLSPSGTFGRHGDIDESNYLITPPYNAYLFAYSKAGKVSGMRPMRIYYFTVENKMNLVPARRDSDGKVGMYDTVRNVFLTNASNGADFTAGPVVNF